MSVKYVVIPVNPVQAINRETFYVITRGELDSGYEFSTDFFTFVRMKFQIPEPAELHVSYDKYLDIYNIRAVWIDVSLAEIEKEQKNV